MSTVEFPIKEITIDPEVYPRKSIDKNHVKLYQKNLDGLPPILITEKDHILVDGAHRLRAFEIEGRETIPSDTIDIPLNQILVEAIKINAKHGKQLTDGEKKNNAIDLISIGYSIGDIAQILGVTDRSVREYTKDWRANDKEKKIERSVDLYLQGNTQNEIGDLLDTPRQTIGRWLGEAQNGNASKMGIPKSLQLTDVWNFPQCDSRYGTPDYPGRAAGQIIENFLYYCTDPFDIVVDPMAGGGTTGDVCKAMHRRYQVYDLHPLKTRPEIIQHDITQGYPAKALGCKAIFLDPPYWKMKDPEYKEGSVSNLSREDFYQFIKKLASDSFQCVSSGGFVGFLFQDSYNAVKGLYKTEPLFTAELYPYFIDVGFKPVYWISVPLSQHHQYTGTKTNIAKEEKVLLHVVRHFIVFQSN